LLDKDNSNRDPGAEATSSLRFSQATLAVCGDPIICQALVLLLRGPDYDVRYVPDASLGVSGTLRGVQLLLLALERDTERRRTVLELLDRTPDADGIHVLELASAFESRPEQRRERTRADRKVSWPCSTEQLKQQIDVALTGRLLFDEAVRCGDF
jgi:hypothetical protein